MSNRADCQEKPTQKAKPLSARDVIECIAFHTSDIREDRENQALRSFIDAVSASAKISAIKQFCAETGASICEPRITKDIGGQSFILVVDANDIFWFRREAWTMAAPYSSMGHNRRALTGLDVLSFTGGVSSLISSIEKLGYTIVAATGRLRKTE
jgi:hypothetical protein